MYLIPCNPNLRSMPDSHLHPRGPHQKGIVPDGLATRGQNTSIFHLFFFHPTLKSSILFTHPSTLVFLHDLAAKTNIMLPTAYPIRKITKEIYPNLCMNLPYCYSLRKKRLLSSKIDSPTAHSHKKKWFLASHYQRVVYFSYTFSCLNSKAL
jgi:hypothetical protein